MWIALRSRALRQLDEVAGIGVHSLPSMAARTPVALRSCAMSGIRGSKKITGLPTIGTHGHRDEDRLPVPNLVVDCVPSLLMLRIVFLSLS